MIHWHSYKIGSRMPSISKLVDNAVLLHIDEDDVSKLEYSSRQMSRLKDAKKGKPPYISFMDKRLVDEQSKLFFIKEKEELVNELKEIYETNGKISSRDRKFLATKYDSNFEYVSARISDIGLSNSPLYSNILGYFTFFDELYHMCKTTKNINLKKLILEHSAHLNLAAMTASVRSRMNLLLKFYGNVTYYGPPSNTIVLWEGVNC